MRPSCLAAQSIARSVNLLQNHQVTLQWEKMILTLRMADLLTLNSVLQDFMLDRQRVWAAIYMLSLHQRLLYVQHDELYSFCALVQEAVEQLPRRTVRWVDYEITIVPLHEDSLAIGCFTAN